MPDRSNPPVQRAIPVEPRGDAPPPDVIEFIRFCYRRRRVGWPEIYDEMCAVAARREFNGWGHEQYMERGLSFALFEMPRLASWVRMTLGTPAEAREPAAVT